MSSKPRNTGWWSITSSLGVGLKVLAYSILSGLCLLEALVRFVPYWIRHT